MASIIKSNTYADFNGREILTANNDGQLTTQKINHPYFAITLSAQQNISDATETVAQFDTIDLNSRGGSTGWDSTNYRYTPGTAGKYLVNSFLWCRTGGNDLDAAYIKIRVNGTAQDRTNFDGGSNNKIDNVTVYQSVIVNLTSDTDYIDVVGYIDTASATPHFFVSSGQGNRLTISRIGS
jgi:hypothetical protein